MTSSLVGSEMCIRDRRFNVFHWGPTSVERRLLRQAEVLPQLQRGRHKRGCLLYTSDAADDM
eukprot:6440428-Prorocentrum_lima.AAC.1